MSTRSELIQALKERKKKSSFETILVDSIYRVVADEKKKTKATAKKVDRLVTGKPFGTLVKFQPNGFYFEVVLDFALAKQGTNVPVPKLTPEEKADWGTGFGNPLVNPKRNCIYVVRARVDQLRVDPMIGGFRLKWIPPAGWVKADPLPLTHYLESASNPILLARKFRSPSYKQKNIVFRVQILSWYP